MKVKIFYHHTDCGGVVYYANYLKFFEEARTELLAERDILIKQLIKQGIQFVVSRQEIDYKSPAFYGDTLQIDTRLINVSGIRIEFDYQIENQNGQIICTGKTSLACVDTNFKPQAIPPEIRAKLT
ncbi:MAG: thioesterase family protein [Candidatus Omnitrophota bacterium]|jgi:acyl-CoA thioester hydrolase